MRLQMIGWALMHSIWQAALIAGIAAVLLAATRRASPSVRYWIGLTGLVLMFALPIATALRVNGAPEATASSGTQYLEATAGEPGTPVSESASPDGAASTPIVEAAQGDGLRTKDFWISGRVMRTAESFIPWIVAAWFIGLVLASIRLLGGIARTRRLTRSGVGKAGDVVEKAVARLSTKIGLARVVRTLESLETHVPLVVGAIRPVIVIPASLVTGLTPLQLDMLLAHELAHIRRHDFLVNLVQTVIETLLFYHPAVRWLSERVREERENCCDDIAVAVCGGNAHAYTETLLVLEESRATNLGFAAAATGGSLLRRAQRLLLGQPSHFELGPRWIAGIVTIAAALLTGREALGLGVQASYAPSGFVAAMDDSGDSTRKSPRNTPNPKSARPSQVFRAPQTGNLESRWRWAEQQGTRLGGTYWVGYIIAGDPDGKRQLYMDDSPVYIAGGITTTGRLLFQDADLSDLTFFGAPLAPIVGQHSSQSMVLMFLLDYRGSGKRVARAHAAPFHLPVHFDGRPLIWLDSASDAESLDIMNHLMGRARTEDMRSNLVSAIGIHRTPDLVVPRLADLLSSRTETEGVRRVAAEWLGYHGTAAAVSALSRAIRADRSEDVKREAIESFSHTPWRGATDSLISYSSTLPLFDQRKTAIEALGNRDDKRAMEYLTMVASSKLDTNLPEHAVEALGSMPDGMGTESVIRLAKSSPSSQVRQNAAESIGHFVPAERALPILREMLRTDPDEAVRYRAAESIVYTKGGDAVLESIIHGNERDELRMVAMRAYLDQVKEARAVALLRKVISTDRSADMRARAQELLADM